MKPELNREFVTDTLAQSILDPRTRALYELCFLHRHHFQDEIVADKLRMIVRLCAEHGLKVNGFSPEFAAHQLGRSGVDRWFAGLATAEQIDMALVFEMHRRVMDVFVHLPAEQSRSLASKYLHFHFPDLFYIYDQRVEAAAIEMGDGECGYLARAERDPAYGRFFACCRKLSDKLSTLAGRRLNPRELDRVLRSWSDHQELSVLPMMQPESRTATHA
jgi:hypothetical protein